MGERSKIEWTDATWNPWQGCVHVSPGCDHCYMYRDKIRYGQDPARVVRSKPPTFDRPLRWNAEAAAAGRRTLVFTASWSDFFIREADEWRDEAWAIIRRCPHLIFQILTKRHGRILQCLPDDWGDGYENVWLGVSAEDAVWFKRRVDALRAVPARVRFVSYEPALGSLRGVSLSGIDQLIIGGESGPQARPFEAAWAREAIDLCRRDGCAPFVKQLGSYVRTRNDDNFTMDEDPWDPAFPPWPLDVAVEEEERGYQGAPVRVRLRDRAGGDPAEWRADLRVREYPKELGAAGRGQA